MDRRLWDTSNDFSWKPDNTDPANPQPPPYPRPPPPPPPLRPDRAGRTRGRL